MNSITQKNFRRTLLSIKTADGKKAALSHACALFALEQAVIHGNSNFMNDLMGALHVSSRVQSLEAWFLHYGKGIVQRDQDKSLKAKGPKKDEIRTMPANILPFWELTKEESGEVQALKIDVQTQVKALIGRIRGNIKKATEEGRPVDVTHGEMLEKLEGLLVAS